MSAITGLAYLAAGLALALGFFHAHLMVRRLGAALALLAALGHATTLWLQVIGPLGYDVNFLNSLSLASLLIVLVLLLSSLRVRNLEAGIIAFPGAALCVWLNWLVDPAPMVLTQVSPMLEVHVFSSLLAYSLLSIAAINAVFLAIQDHLLRHPRPLRQLELLPPLSTLEIMMFRLILGGWLVLSLSLLTGLMFVDDLMAQHLAHKTVLSLMSWLLFGLLLGGRWWFGWRGRRAVNWTLLAMLTLALAYFGSKLVLEVILDRSWSGPMSTQAFHGEP
ncbi:MAG: cytochrome c biogenesis protein CcsA [Wenzhouxiangella sp.]|nr:cytochrome c biogenesis protein CcsA [Wenzhouxiangella sp.]MCH8478490.1 cytochrome c biogenesis protein CcsA [Wenzhouxiangella sp.]TVR98726.1 MAG: hypothetical protein EA418_00920 [Wenzhouxiangellaceae bacterium]